MNNNTFIYIIIFSIFLVILIFGVSLLNGNLSNGEKMELEKRIMIESNLPRVNFDENKLNNISTLKNIKN